MSDHQEPLDIDLERWTGFVETFRSALEFAPTAPPHPPDLLGWERQEYGAVCIKCAMRATVRGFVGLLAGFDPVWMPDKLGPCIVCPPPVRISDTEACNLIEKAMSGKEWDSDMIVVVSEIITMTGRKLDPPPEEQGS